MPEYLQLSPENTEACKRLFQFAGKVAVLFASKRVQSHPSMQAALDDLLGAVYSLIYAKSHGYEDRHQSLGSNDIQAVVVRATDMSSGKVRTEGKWTAGFYFNNALFRIAAVYHRALKIITGKENSKKVVDKLLPIAKELHEHWRDGRWANVKLAKLHKEVNGLKHSSSGIYLGRTIRFEEAIQAVDKLVNLIEAWT
jgi:hypothetical protein